MRRAVSWVLWLLLALTRCGAAATCYVPSQDSDCGALVCNQTSSTCTRCSTDADCFFMQMECIQGKCTGTDITDAFQKAPLWIVIGFVAGTAVCGIGVVAGVGGGAVLTPLYATILGLPSSAAVVASLSTIAGQGILNVPLLAVKWHVYRPRALINYRIMALWFPLTAAGSTIGTIFAPLFLAWFRSVLLIVIQIFTALRVAKYARKAKEGAMEKPEPADTRPTDAHSRVDIAAISTIVGAVILGCAGKVLADRAGCGSFRYWLTVAGTMGVFIYMYGIWAIKTQTLHERVQRRLVPGVQVHFDITRASLLRLPLASIGAGFCSTTVGIGATLINPLLLAAGLVPEEVSATGSFFTFLVAVQAASAELLSGGSQLSPGWQAYFVSIGLLSTVIGRFVLLPLCRRYGAQYMILMMMILMLVIGIVVLLVFTVIVLVQMNEYDQPFSFGRLCGPSGGG